MSWFNYYGVAIICILMIPNVIFALKHRDGFTNYYNNKFVLISEQIGRFSCFGLMIINIPGTVFGWMLDNGLLFYLIINGILLLAYCTIWIFVMNRNTVFKALSLSIIPSVIFLFSGIMMKSILLIIAAIIFAPAHILISYKNVIMDRNGNE